MIRSPNTKNCHHLGFVTNRKIAEKLRKFRSHLYGVETPEMRIKVNIEIFVKYQENHAVPISDKFIFSRKIF